MWWIVSAVVLVLLVSIFLMRRRRRGEPKGLSPDVGRRFDDAANKARESDPHGWVGGGGGPM